MNVTLASTLLDLALENDAIAAEAGGTTWRTGVSVLDSGLPETLWEGGRVIGVGSVGATTGGGGGGGGGGDGGRMARKTTPSIPLEIIATQLLTTNPTNTETDTDTSDFPSPSPIPQPSVFILSPPTTSTQTLQHLHTLLTTRLSHTQPQPQKQNRKSNPNATASTQPLSTSEAKTKAKALLSNISLLQHLDIPGLISALSEIQQTLHTLHARHTASASGSTTSKPAPQQQQQRRCIVLIQGLTAAAARMLRRNGVLQTAALLEAVGRGVRAVVREAGLGGCLCLVEGEFWWGRNAYDGTGIDGESGGGLQSAFTPMPIPSTDGSRDGSGSGGGRVLSVNINGNANGQDILGRLVEGMMDAVVVVHNRMNTNGSERDENGKKVRVVEVVKEERVVIGIDADNLQDGYVSALGRWVVCE